MARPNESAAPVAVGKESPLEGVALITANLLIEALCDGDSKKILAAKGMLQNLPDDGEMLLRVLNHVVREVSSGQLSVPESDAAELGSLRGTVAAAAGNVTSGNLLSGFDVTKLMGPNAERFEKVCESLQRRLVRGLASDPEKWSPAGDAGRIFYRNHPLTPQAMLSFAGMMRKFLIPMLDRGALLKGDTESLQDFEARGDQIVFQCEIMVNGHLVLERQYRYHVAEMGLAHHMMIFLSQHMPELSLDDEISFSASKVDSGERYCQHDQDRFVFSDLLRAGVPEGGDSYCFVDLFDLDRSDEYELYPFPAEEQQAGAEAMGDRAEVESRPGFWEELRTDFLSPKEIRDCEGTARFLQGKLTKGLPEDRTRLTQGKHGSMVFFEGHPMTPEMILLMSALQHYFLCGLCEALFRSELSKADKAKVNSKVRLWVGDELLIDDIYRGVFELGDVYSTVFTQLVIALSQMNLSALTLDTPFSFEVIELESSEEGGREIPRRTKDRTRRTLHQIVSLIEENDLSMAGSYTFDALIAPDSSGIIPRSLSQVYPFIRRGRRG